MRECVILSTAPRREADSRGCRGIKIEENPPENLSGTASVFGSLVVGISDHF